GATSEVLTPITGARSSTTTVGGDVMARARPEIAWRDPPPPSWRSRVMKRFALVGRTVVALVLFAGLMALTTAHPADAVSKYTRIRIHKSSCPHNTKGDIFVHCYGNVQSGITFIVFNPTGHGTARATDANGFASFGPRAGRITIQEDPASFSRYGKARVFCAIKNGGVQGPTLYDAATTQSSIQIQTGAGDTVHCDWYDLT